MHAQTSISQRIQAGWLHPGWRNLLLLPLSWLYRLLTSLRRLGYSLGLFSSHRLRVPVIVVGNISVGGTGKSPLVMALVQQLETQGFRPGVVARGYGGEPGFTPRVVVSNDTAEEVGDEPLMIGRLTNSPVVVGPDRVLSGQLLIDKYQCDVIVSDDGFQHFALQRDIDIVVIDGARGFGNGWCLPAGPLREPVSGLARADFRVINAATGSEDNDRSNSELSEWVMTLASRDLRALGDPEETIPLAQLTGQRVDAVAGLGNPQRFYRQLTQAGLDVVPHSFPDHHRYTAADFQFCNEQTVLIMTEKDAVKCDNLTIPGSSWVLPVAAELSPAFFAAIEQKIKQLQSESNSPN